MNVFELFASIELDDQGYVRALDRAEQKTDRASRNMQSTFTRRLDAMQASLKGFGDRAQRIGGTLSRRVTAPLVAAGGAAFLAADRFSRAADAIDKGSQSAGLSAERYQTLRFAFEQSGISAEQFDLSLNSLNRRLGLAAQGNQTYADAYARLGVATRDANGDLRSTEDVFDDLLPALASMDSSAEQAATASIVFGDDVGKRLVPVLQQGADGIAELEQAARDAGIVLSRDDIVGLVAYRDRMNEVRNALQTAGTQITAAFLPILEGFVDTIQNRVVPALRDFAGRVESLIVWWAGLDEGAQTFVTTIVAAFAAAGPVVMSIGIVTTALSALLTPWGVIAGAVAAFVVAYQRNFLGLKDITEPVVTFIVTALGTIIDVGKNIIGNWTSVRRGFGIIVQNMATVAGLVGDSIAARFDVMRVAVYQTFVLMGQSVTKVFGDILNGIVSGINTVISGLNRVGADIDPLAGVDTDSWEELTQGFTEELDRARSRIDDINQDLRVARLDVLNSAAEFYEMIQSGTGDTVEALGRVGDKTGETASAFEASFGNDIPSSLDTGGEAVTGFTTNVDNASASVQDLTEDWAAFTLAAIERTEGPIGSVERLYEVFGRLGMVVTPGLLDLVSNGVTRRQRELARGYRVERAEAQRHAEWTREYQASRIAASENANNRLVAAEVDAARRRADAYLGFLQDRADGVSELEAQLAREKAIFRDAVDFAQGLSGSFSNAFSTFGNELKNLLGSIIQTVATSGKSLGDALGDMVKGVGINMQNLAQVVASGVVAFVSGIGQMIGAAAAGESIGENLSRMVLSLIRELTAMVVAIAVTASVMIGQIWNPWLMAAGVAGLAAASAGLAWLNARGGNGSIPNTGGGGGGAGGDGTYSGGPRVARDEEGNPMISENTATFEGITAEYGSIAYFQQENQALRRLYSNTTDPEIRQLALDQIENNERQIEIIRNEGKEEEEERELGRVEQLRADIRELEEQRDRATDPAEIRQLNQEIADKRAELNRLLGLGTEDDTPAATDTPDTSAPAPTTPTPGPSGLDEDMPVWSEQEALDSARTDFGASGQSVQLAVATPLLQAAQTFKTAAETLTGGVGSNIYATHATAMQNHSLWLQRMIEEGFNIKLATQNDTIEVTLPRYI